MKIKVALSPTVIKKQKKQNTLGVFMLLLFYSFGFGLYGENLIY